MGVSLDGYIVGPDGGFDWTAPDEEVFRFVTDEIREVGVHLLGRRLYETMLYWETADQDPSLDDSMLEWAAIWKALPKVAFSTTLSAVQGNARLASGGLAEIERLRAEPAEGHIAIGGSTLAAEAAALGLIDEYRARVHPVLVGGGIPFFPSASAGWISNSSRPAPSARESSTSATAWRASRLVLRYLLACSAHAPVTGSVVARTFLQASNAHGLPAPAPAPLHPRPGVPGTPQGRTRWRLQNPPGQGCPAKRAALPN